VSRRRKGGRFFSVITPGPEDETVVSEADLIIVPADELMGWSPSVVCRMADEASKVAVLGCQLPPGFPDVIGVVPTGVVVRGEALPAVFGLLVACDRRRNAAYRGGVRAGNAFVALVGEVCVFGRALGAGEIAEREYELGAEAFEVGNVLERCLNLEAIGRIWAKAWSPLVPEGEFGSFGQADMVRIARKDFDQAEREGWSPVVFRKRPELADALVDLRRRALEESS